MSTSKDFIEFVYNQIDDKWEKRYKKMFGEYLVYINDKPMLLVCDDIVFIKPLDAVKDFFSEEDKECPYQGAKEHYMISPEEKEKLNKIIEILDKVIDIKIKKKKFKNDSKK